MPVYGGEPIAQPIIAQVSFISVGIDCAGTNNVTAVLNGIEFKASAEILWTANSINPTAQLDDDQKPDWPITVSGDQTFTLSGSAGPHVLDESGRLQWSGVYFHDESNTAVLTFNTGSDTATASTQIKCYLPDITVTKTAVPASVPETGGEVTFTFKVSNTRSLIR